MDTKINQSVQKSFEIISPYWPLKNVIAVNPLRGFEDLPIEQALDKAAVYFQKTPLCKNMEALNRETIKWLQVFCDDGQATITMPLRDKGLYKSWRLLCIYDDNLHFHCNEKIDFLKSLPEDSNQAIERCLVKLGVENKQHCHFLTLLLVTLPGWAGYIKYRTEWAGLDVNHPYSVTQSDYLALRIVMFALFFDNATSLLELFPETEERDLSIGVMQDVDRAEEKYCLPLLRELVLYRKKELYIPKVQMVFCIDVRSERFRRAIETIEGYSTLGFAGFFGLPVKITDRSNQTSYASCPVLLTPQYEVEQTFCDLKQTDRKENGCFNIFRKVYQSLKYNFITPFGLVEGSGLFLGFWMLLRCFFPNLAAEIKKYWTHRLDHTHTTELSIDNISIQQQAMYAESVLTTMGLTHNFAPIVMFCGHGSLTHNNSYATALDCGACGGRRGGTNARILAKILNNPSVRETLVKRGIIIPEKTYFIAGEHNTTTDDVTIFDQTLHVGLLKLKRDLEIAREITCRERIKEITGNLNYRLSSMDLALRAQDFAQVRPEWGLARNASFIIGPRNITKNINLQGRAFLHSYDYEKDMDASSLTTILTAPMVVAQWINSQYFFSTLDNAVYGGGSKITQNVTGKIGLMQGNASDLMTGLPLQSVYYDDSNSYHEVQRLLTIVYAPRERIDLVISNQEILRKLFGNGWLRLACIEPKNHEIYILQRDLTWNIMLKE